MWADVARRAGVDVTHGAAKAVAQHFDIGTMEMVGAGAELLLDGCVVGMD